MSKFNPQKNTTEFIQHLEKQPTANWGFGEKLIQKTAESLARESHEETQMH